MTVKEFYTAAGGSYEDALSRLMDDKRIVKYLRKFILTTDYTDMLAAIEEKKWEDAFRASHNLKGMALNLSIGTLASSASELCETMRHGAPARDITALKTRVGEDYKNAVDLINSIEG